jgi:hypothetical protein
MAGLRSKKFWGNPFKQSRVPPTHECSKKRVLALLDSGELAGHLEARTGVFIVWILKNYLDQKKAPEILEWMTVKERIRDEVAVRITDTAKEIAAKKVKAQGCYIIPDWILHEAFEDARRTCAGMRSKRLLQER